MRPIGPPVITTAVSLLLNASGPYPLVMGPDLPGDEPEEPDLETVLGALQDPDCRRIVSVLTEPMTAEEISEETDIPKSTLYRKLELLTDASLLAEGVEVRTGGQHASRYGVAFDEVHVGLDADGDFELDISRESETADERLASLWSEVRKET